MTNGRKGCHSLYFLPTLKGNVSALLISVEGFIPQSCTGFKTTCYLNKYWFSGYGAWNKLLIFRPNNRYPWWTGHNAHWRLIWSYSSDKIKSTNLTHKLKKRKHWLWNCVIKFWTRYFGYFWKYSVSWKDGFLPIFQTFSRIICKQLNTCIFKIWFFHLR